VIGRQVYTEPCGCVFERIRNGRRWGRWELVNYCGLAWTAREKPGSDPHEVRAQWAEFASADGRI
jgi:hypothetical protein